MPVRPATPADAREMAEVIVASWRWAYREVLPADYLASLDPSVRGERIRASLADGASSMMAWVAVDQGCIVGAASSGPPLEDEGHVAEPPPPDSGELYLLYVEPPSVGRGFGKALLDTATDGLRKQGFSTAFLWVLEGNARARRFYEKAGWAWDGTTSSHMIECQNMPVVRYIRRL
jgi:GNAT superfamily N-acetyltransferase